MVSHTSSLLVLFVVTLGNFQHGTVLGSTHECSCEYNAQYPKGHCTCVPPIPGGGRDPSTTTPNPIEGTTHICTCVYNAQYPKGHCTCVPPIPGGGKDPDPIGTTTPRQDRPDPDKPKTYICKCVKNEQYPKGHCSCDPDMCFKDKNGERQCVSG